VGARLIVSLSGLSEDSLGRGAEFAAALDGRGVPVSQLYRPGPFTSALAGSDLVRWLHDRRDRGDAIVLHGYDHSVEPLVTGQRARVGRRAEFAALPRHEAGLRLRAARRTLAAVDLRTTAFVPPRWIASAAPSRRCASRASPSSPTSTACTGSTAPARCGRACSASACRASGGRWPTTPGARGLAGPGAAGRGGAHRPPRRTGADPRAGEGPAPPGRATAALAAVDEALALGAGPVTHHLPDAVRAA
jgi:hypothetical protein